jgi:hypothetical protein
VSDWNEAAFWAKDAIKEARRQRRQAKQAEQIKAAVAWAEATPVVVRPLPDTLLDDVRRRYTLAGHADIFREKALYSHVRHHYSNYDELRKQWNGTICYSAVWAVLRPRTDEAVQQAVQQWKEVNL